MRKLITFLIEKIPWTEPLLHGVRKRSIRKQLVILNYHTVVGKNDFLPDWCCLHESRFLAQMSYLQKRFTILDLAEGIKRLQRGDHPSKPMAAVTFDDGFQNNYESAFPILKHLGIPATIFLVTGFIDSEKRLWYSRLNEAVASTSAKQFSWRQQTFPLVNLQDKTMLYRKLQRDLKALPHDQLLEECDAIVNQLTAKTVIDSKKCSQQYRLLDLPSIREMGDSGLISFGAHTRDHVILSRVSEVCQREQILGSIADVRSITGQENVVFSYPNGTDDDYDRTSITMLRQAGGSLAVTTKPGFNSVVTPPYELKRIGVGGNWQKGMFEFAINTAITSNI